MRRIIGSSLILLTLSACSATHEGDSLETVQDELIGGRVAAESEYPATVSLNGCTGVKVGPRHFLSAAHCFGDPSMATLSVMSDNSGQNYQTLTVSSVNIHPQWTNCTACTGADSWTDFGYRPDVVLIIVHQLTPSIPTAVIDPVPTAIGTSVTLTGYGCENLVGQPTGPSRFKVGDSQTVDPLSLVPGVTSILGGYSTSYGSGLTPGAPGLCPGDSGGPLYRTGTNKVVGINALLSSADGVVYGNWFTRVDQQSRYDVYGWLTTLINQPVPMPCTDLCPSPTTFSTQYFSSQNIGTSARCYEGIATLVSGSCTGFASPRTLTINGTAMACNGQNWTLPPKRNGGYCFQVSAGQNPWAQFNTF